VAIKDPKARRAAVHYPGGKVVGALGLLEFLFGANAVSSGYAIKIDARGRRRLTGLMNKTAAVGGKQIIIDTKAGDRYQLHYTGTLVDWAEQGATKLSGANVLSWSTVRGKKRYI
jgi:hypothetical protein